MRVDQLKKSTELTNSVTATAAVKKQESALEQQQPWSEAQAAQERWSPKEHFGHHGKVTPT